MNAVVDDIEQSLLIAFEQKTKKFLIKLLKLDDDIDLQVDGDLIKQIGLDSIEAFDAVASLHELLDVAIPDTFNPKVANSIRDLSRYVLETFGPDTAQLFIDIDLDQASIFMRDEDL